MILCLLFINVSEELSSYFVAVYVKEIKVQGIEKIKEKKSRHELRKRDDHRYVLQVIIMAWPN